MKVILTVTLILSLLSLTCVPILATSGAVHNISSTISGDVWVDYQSTTGTPPTTLNLLSGGILNGHLSAYTSSKINISGGRITQYAYSFDTAEVIMTSGSLVYLFTGDYSRAYISGGTVGHLDVNYEGQVTISGSGFAVDGVPLTGNRLLTSIYGREYGDDPSRVLTGTLANGDPINATFQIGKWASISVVPVPEPSSLLAIGVGFAGMANTKRRK